LGRGKPEPQTSHLKIYLAIKEQGIRHSLPRPGIPSPPSPWGGGEPETKTQKNTKFQTNRTTGKASIARARKTSLAKIIGLPAKI